MKHINEINSVRQFNVVIMEGGEVFENTGFSIQELIELDFEWAYAICDTFDDLLDLNVGEMYFTRANRDDKNSFITITRIN